MDSEIVRREIRVTGDVQGVGFRYRARYAAEGLGLTGWVKNDWDGSVLMEVQGPLETIHRMMKMINQSSYIRMDRVDWRELKTEEYESGFHIR